MLEPLRGIPWLEFKGNHTKWNEGIFYRYFLSLVSFIFNSATSARWCSRASKLEDSERGKKLENVPQCEEKLACGRD